MIELDPLLLPTIVRGRVLIGMPRWLEDKLKALDLPETLDRLRGASNFMGQVSPENSDWQNRALIRAAASEFRSVREALRWDLGEGSHYTPLASRNPLVHLVFRLRRIAVYLANATMRKRDTSYPILLFDEEKMVDVPVLLIEDAAGYFLRERRLLQTYEPKHISLACQWFEENQLKYGAELLLDVGILMYCEELCDVYSQRADQVASSRSTISQPSKTSRRVGFSDGRSDADCR